MGTNANVIQWVGSLAGKCCAKQSVGDKIKIVQTARWNGKFLFKEFPEDLNKTKIKKEWRTPLRNAIKGVDRPIQDKDPMLNDLHQRMVAYLKKEKKADNTRRRLMSRRSNRRYNS